MKLSVVIPARNRVDNLRRTLYALEHQSLPRTEYEVILSDDNSTDETQSMINAWRETNNFKYIFNCVPKPHSWNASIPRNLGALVAEESTIAYLFVDSDVELPGKALENYAEDLEKNPNRVIIGPYDFYREGNLEIAQKDVRSKKFEEVDINDTFDTVHDGLACFGGNLCIPKEIFWSVLGFSTDTHIGLEDGDMGLKLWKKGTKFSYDSRNRGIHLFHSTPDDRFPPDMKAHIDKLNMKHFGTIDPDYGIIEASRETYAKWGITGWNPPKEWQRNVIDLKMKVNKNAI